MLLTDPKIIIIERGVTDLDGLDVNADCACEFDGWHHTQVFVDALVAYSVFDIS